MNGCFHHESLAVSEFRGRMLKMPYLEAMTSQQRDEGFPNSKSAQNVATNASYFYPNVKDGSDVSFVSYYIPGFIAGHTGDLFLITMVVEEENTFKCKYIKSGCTKVKLL